MPASYKSIIDSTPSEVKFKDIVEIDRLVERMSAVSVLFSSIIEVGEGYIEFCPENEPPSIEETISWVWTFRPDLGSTILKHTLSTDLRLLIDAYQTGDMPNWWDHINKR